MGANIAGIYGAQIFRQDDRPLYIRGFTINIIILVVGLLLAAVRFVDDRIRRRRDAKLRPETASEELAEQEKVPRPSDVQPTPILIDSDFKPVVSDAVPK